MGSSQSSRGVHGKGDQGAQVAQGAKCLTYIEGSTDPFLVIRPISVLLELRGKSYNVTVQEGFRCDGPSLTENASVKRLLSRVVHGWCVHDWLYATHGLADFEDELSKDEVDQACLNAAIVFGMKFTKRDEQSWVNSFMREDRLCGTPFGKAQGMIEPPQYQIDRQKVALEEKDNTDYEIGRMVGPDVKIRGRRHSEASPMQHRSPISSRSRSQIPPSIATQVVYIPAPMQFQPSFEMQNGQMIVSSSLPFDSSIPHRIEVAPQFASSFNPDRLYINEQQQVVFPSNVPSSFNFAQPLQYPEMQIAEQYPEQQVQMMEQYPEQVVYQEQPMMFEEMPPRYSEISGLAPKMEVSTPPEYSDLHAQQHGELSRIIKTNGVKCPKN
eukprot:TRINITY_DN22674_c0_g1_i1.p1 TRINITY_DN22674_c0_g1~~TRINITY_DN22674_c0_g1_i1.p1  ORF type:complete len:383 (+),score=109.43 TRINITY_DN22674_c0_g1_i1:48-1196(+)